MPLIIAALWGALIPMLGTMVGRVLLSIGIGYVTYTGIDYTLQWVQLQFTASLSGLPAAAVGLANQLKVGICVSMLLSAVTVRVTMQGLQNGSLKRMTLK